MAQVPLVDLKAQYASIRPEMDAAIARVLESTSFILGEEVARFESEWAAYVGAAGAVGVASGTAALELALAACGIGPGDEVITTAHTFIATAEAISNVGARPVFADIDPETYDLDPGAVDAAVTDRTRAVIPVHLYGRPAAMDDLLAICRRHGLQLIEDAAQAHGARYRDRGCGSIGDLACFSFYPGKNLGAYGDAGAVTGNDPELLSRVRKLRDHGRLTKYEHDEIGRGERLDALQAAVLSVKLAHLDAWTEARRRHAATYDRRLDGIVGTPRQDPRDRHVFHLYVIRSPHRDALLSGLKARGVGAGIHYPIPLHRQPAYLRLGYGDVSLPETERAAAEVLSLPLYPELTEAQVGWVADQVAELVGQVASEAAPEAGDDVRGVPA
ncbi:MAG TPA: DegT/DnrJ/EryC1/StrS family aminotransferase [Candidatus Limnocylindrales bacterium]|nr:DegT/DnrJ/EryC1/StrS family aminotransferase [Candidatus Limnocylindrales bacterium]